MLVQPGLSIFVAMDNFIVSARKYRPATFETVVGQRHITNTLKNAIRNNQLAQAFLFCGPRGVGKTTCARILAKTINCQNLSPDAEACGICDSCRAFQNGNSFNIHELDAASNNSVDDIRSLTEQVRIPPQAGKYKIYIIDEVHMLSAAAFNAFLKTLEEPPSYAIFILATTEKHKILPTILSRCQIFDFNRIKVDDIADHLAGIADKESIGYDQDGLHLIAQKADGGLRDALSMFDQIVSFSDRNVTYKAVIDNLNILDYDYYFRLCDTLLQEDGAQALLIFDEILSAGFDGNHFITGLASHFRNLLVGKDAVTYQLLEVSEGIKKKYQEQSQRAPASFLLSALSIANQCDINYRSSKNQRLQVELALLKIAHLPSVLQPGASAVPAEASQRAGQEKKNSEPVKAAPVSVTPEPAQPVQKEQPVVKPEPVPEAGTVIDGIPTETPLIPQPEEKKPATKPKISMPMAAPVTLIPNLTDLNVPGMVEESAKEYLTGDKADEFSEERLMELWEAYAEKANAEKKINLYTLLKSNKPLLSDNFMINLQVENKLQQDLLHTEKIDLLNFLSQELNNYSIDIHAAISDQPQKKHLYTDTEKYQHMVEKNPNLEEFRKRYNLDMD